MVSVGIAFSLWLISDKKERSPHHLKNGELIVKLVLHFFLFAGYLIRLLHKSNTYYY